MNAAQMHLDFLEMVDEFNTAELVESQIDTYLRWASEDILDEKFAPERRAKHKGLEKTQKVASDLRTLKDTQSIASGSITNNIATLPTDLRYPLSFDVELTAYNVTGTVWRNNIRKRDDGHRSRLQNGLAYNSLYYSPVYIPTEDGYEIFVGEHNQIPVTVSSAKIRYIKNPVHASKSASFTASTSLTVGNVIHVDSGSIIYNSVTYNAKDTFTVVSGFTSFTGSGTASVIVNSQFPDSVHVEIVRRAAIIHEGIIGDREEKASLMQDEIE